MGTQKLGHNSEQLARLENEARKLIGTKDEFIYKAFMLIRRHGCHVSVIENWKGWSELRTEIANTGVKRILWYRTMKGGNPKKNLAHTEHKLHKSITFDVDEFSKWNNKLWSRKARRTGSQSYLRGLTALGERAGVPGVSPNSLRHSIGLELARLGFNRSEIKQFLNCSDDSLDYYLKHASQGLDERLEDKGY